MILFDKSGYVLIAFLSVSLHEGAHILMMKIFGAEVNSVGFEPFGIIIKKEKFELKSAQSMAVSCAGCFVNFVVGISFLFVYFISKTKYSLVISEVNFLLFAVNILPVKNLDGGDLLKAVLLRHMPCVKAEKISKAVSIIICIFMLLAGITICAKVGFNPSLIILSLYLGISSFLSVPD